MADPSPAARTVDVFQWEDGQGIVHFADALEKVPGELRAKAKKISFADDRGSAGELRKELEGRIPPKVKSRSARSPSASRRPSICTGPPLGSAWGWP